jgi:hypothetical protein
METHHFLFLNGDSKKDICLISNAYKKVCGEANQKIYYHVVFSSHLETMFGCVFKWPIDVCGEIAKLLVFGIQ